VTIQFDGAHQDGICMKEILLLITKLIGPLLAVEQVISVTQYDNEERRRDTNRRHIMATQNGTSRTTCGLPVRAVS
jgi:hypothetical protein